MPDEYAEYDVTIHAIVTSTSLIDARTAILRSGINSGLLIGEVLVTEVEVEGE